MKAHTQTFKENLTNLGKEITAKITYTIDGVETELDGDNLSSVEPHFEGNLLKSVMKQVDIMSDIDIPINTEINVQFGMKFDDEEFEYIDYGNYIVYSSEKQEDTNNYKIIAYDKMLYAMKDYEPIVGSNLFNSEIEQGAINANSGQTYEQCKTDNTTRIRIKDLIELDKTKQYTISCKTGYNVVLQAFNDEQLLYIIDGTTNTWISSKTFTNIPYIAIAIRKTDNSNITPDEIEDIEVVLKEGTQDTIIYPVSIKEFIENLCSKIGLEFANSNEVFANYDKEIPNELYSNLGYTYRDVLDELAQVTASTICINDNDQLEIRYLNESVNESEEVEGSSISISDSESAKINDVMVEGNTTQDSVILPSGYTQVDYITSDGDAFINTNQALGTNFKINIDFTSNQITTAEQPIVSTWNGTNNYWNFFINTQGKADLYVKAHKIADTTDITSKSSNAIIIRNGNDWKLITNGNTLTFTDTTLTDNPTTLKVFKRGDSNNKSYISVGKVKVWNNNVIVRYLIPCYRNSDNVIGMYDLVNKVFYTNAGSGAFTKGANSNLSSPQYPIEIKTNTGLQKICINQKNFLNLKTARFYSKGANVSYNIIGSNEIHLESTSGTYARAWFNLDMPNATTIRVSAIAKDSTETLENVGIGVDRFPKGSTTRDTYNEMWFNATERTNKTRKAFNIANVDNSKYDYRIAFFVTQTQNIANKVDFYDIQIELGNTTTDFEEYKGNKYEVNLGENILPENKYRENGVFNGITYTNNQDGSFNLVGTATANTSVAIIPTGNFELEKDQAYYLYCSVPYNSNTFNMSIALMDDGIRRYILANNTYTPSGKVTEPFLTFYIPSGQSVNQTNIRMMLVKGNQKPEKYLPYFEPIELCKIGNYQDKIFKSKGINLFDGIFRQGNRYTNGLSDTTRLFNQNNFYLEAGKTYIMSTTLNTSSYKWAVNLSAIPFPIASGTSYFYDSGWKTSSSFSFTPSQSGYLGIVVAKPNGTDTLTPSDISSYTWQLQKGNQATTFEPYGSKGKWLLHKEIGKHKIIASDVLNFNNVLTNSKEARVKQATIGCEIGYLGMLYSNNFKYRANGTWDIDQVGIMKGAGNPVTDIAFRVPSSATASWFTDNETILYFPLATPTTEEITNEYVLKDLIALDKAKTYEGTTNITSSFPIKFSYATDYETIDEDYIKNTRASFGEKYGPINSIVLSRSADSDNIYIQDEQSIEENGLCELKISDNQIMNSDNRNEYLDDLLDYLGGIEYYTNDYESIGITYLDLCDKYKVQIGDTKYDCIMFNDEVEIHDGLNEIIYTKKPEETITDYKKADKTDQKIIKTNLEVDKQAQRITALVGNTEENFSQIQVEVDRISSEVQSTNVEIDELGNEINVVRNSITEQTSEAITDWFNSSLKSTIEDLENSVDSNDQSINEIKSYVRRGIITDPQSPYYNQAFVELGDTTNQTTLRILPNRIQFLTNGQETAFISNNQLYINESTILTKEKVGHWVTTEDEDGLLNTYWED